MERGPRPQQRSTAAVRGRARAPKRKPGVQVIVQRDRERRDGKIVASGGKAMTLQLDMSANADLAFFGDVRHLVDSLRVAYAVHHARSVLWAQDPQDGSRRPKMMSRGDKRIDRMYYYDEVGTWPQASRYRTEGQTVARDGYFLRTGKAARDWLIGKITGSAVNARALVAVSAEKSRRAAASNALRAGVDLHTTRGAVESITNAIVEAWTKQSIGPASPLMENPNLSQATYANAPRTTVYIAGQT